jgi:hypothetical protein
VLTEPELDILLRKSNKGRKGPVKRQNIIRSILAAELVLLAPLLGMLLSNEVDWGPADFIIVAIILAGIGTAYQLIVKGIKNDTKQAAIGIVLAAAMVLIWIELAVGLFGSPLAGS